MAAAIQERIRSQKIPCVLLAALASEPGSIVYATEVTDWIKSRPVSAAKAARLLKALTEIEWFLATSDGRPDLSDPANVAATIDSRKEHQAALNTVAKILASDDRPDRAPTRAAMPACLTVET